MAEKSSDILQGLLDSPVDPGTNLPAPEGSTPTNGRTIDLTGLLEAPADGAFRPALGAGPIDTTLDPEAFKRIAQLRPGDDHEERRARAQTWWDIAKGSAVQSVATAFGGTIENMGYLVDLLNPEFYSTLAEGQRTFENNWISEMGRRLQEAAREGVPVYQTRRAQEGFAPGDMTWWGSHVPSIFSSIGLIIPAGGVATAAGRAARALQMTRTAQGATRTVSASLASRHMYSSLESAELYERRYQELLQRGYRDEVARESAGAAAGFNYIAGYMNLYKDVLAWSIAFKGINYASRAVQDRTRNFAANAPRNSRVAQLVRSDQREMPAWLRGSRDLLKVGAAESLEEVNIQYQKMVADRWADEMLGMAPGERVDGVSYFLSTLGDGSVGEHLRDRHTWDSAFWGFMGGMVFGGLSRPAMAAMNSGERAAADRQIRDIETQLHGVNNALDNYADAVQKGDQAAAEMILTDTLGKINMSAIRDGTLEINKDIYNSILEASDQQIQEMGFDQGAKESARLALDHAERIEKSFNNFMNMELGENTHHIALQAAWLETDAYFADQAASKHEMEFNTQFEDTGMYTSLSDTGKERARLRNQEIALIHAIESQEAVLEAMKQGEPASPMDRIRQESLEEIVAEMKNELNEVRDRRTDADGRSQSNLSRDAHNRETKIVNLTPKSKGAALQLFRAYDAKSLARIRNAELARVLDDDNIQFINDYMAEQREADLRRAEEQTKETEEAEKRSEQREQSKEEKQQTERSAFIDRNSVELEKLGFPFDTLDQYSMADLQVAIDQEIGPQELSRMKQAEQASDRQSDPGAGMPTVDQASADLLAKKFGLKKDKASDAAAETTPDGKPDEHTPEQPSRTEQTPIETETSQREVSEFHPEDINPLTPEEFAEGEWFENLEMPAGEIELVPVEGYIYMVDPGNGTIYDSKTRVIEEGSALHGHLLEQMHKEMPELARRIERKGLADIDGTVVHVKLADGDRKLIVDENGGVFDARTGVPIDNERVQNMALVKAENNPGRWYKDDNIRVAVLSDNRIISISKNNAGTEVYKADTTPQAQGMRDKILEAIAEQQTAEEQAQQATADQSVQTGQETVRDDSTELLQDFPDDTAFDYDRVRPESKLYWKSTRNKYGQEGGNEGATAFFEDPNAQVVGSPVQFVPSTDEAVLQNLPEEIAQAYRDGKPVVRQGNEFYIDTAKGRRKLRDDHFPPIAAHVMNQRGERILADGQEVRAFLPQPYTVREGRLLTDRQKSEAIRKVLANRVEMYNAYHAGTPIQSKIASRSSGFPITDRNSDGTPQRNNVSEYLQSLDQQGINYRFGLINRDSTPVDRRGPFMMEIEGQPGNFILFIEGFEGKYYPHKLNVRGINREEANFAASLVRGYLNGEIGLNDVITPEISTKVNGMTVQEFFDLLVFHGRDETNIYTKEPNDYRRGRVMYFSTAGGTRSFYLGDRRYTAENINEEVSRIASHLMTHKNHQVSRKGFGDGDRLSSIIGRDETITWFNRQIQTGDPGSYRQFLFEGADPAVTTDAAISTPPLTQPSIHFDTDMGTTSSQGEVQRVEVEGTEYDVFLDEGRIVNLNTGNEISAISPRGKQVLNQVNWDQAETTQQDQQTRQSEQQNLDDKYGDHLRGIDPIDPVRFSASRPNKPNFDVDIQAEIDAARELLPPGVEMNIDPRISIFAKLAGHENPSQVYGMFHRGMIYMAEHAPEGTAYHEAFHAVFNLSLTEESRNEIYRETEAKFRERYGRKHENDLELEEFLADEFAVYMTRDGNHSVAEKTDGFFRRIWNWIKNLFQQRSQADRLFERISSGFYSQAPRYSSEFAQNLSPRFKDESDAFTPAIKDAIVRSLAYQVARRANFQTSEDVTNIDLQEVPNLIAGYYQRYRNAVDLKKANIWGQALVPETRQKIVEGVEDFFYSLGIHGKNHKVFEYDMHARQEYDDVDYRQRDTKERLFIPTAYEYSNWDSAGANTKLMVSLLPKIRSAEKNADGSYQYEYNEVTGDPVFVDGERVWNMLMDGLSDIVTTSEATSWSQIVSRVRELGRREPSLHLLADRLESGDMPQHKKSEFYNAVGSKVAMNFKTMIAGPNENRRRPDADPSEPSPFDVAIFDSDLYRQGRKTVKQWRSGFRGRFFSTRDGELVINRTDLSHAVNEYKIARNALMSDISRDNLQSLASALNRVSIRMDLQTLESFFNAQDSLEGARKYLLSQLDTIFLDTKAKSFANMVHHKVPETAMVSDNPFDLRPMRMLAQMHNRAHTELSENTILAAEAKSKWIYSEANYYFDTLNRLKNDPAYRRVTHKGRMTNNLKILDAIEQGRELRYTTVANVKSRRKFDDGRDFADSTPYEEFVLKYNALLRGMAPALNFSDKKTAMLLEGLEFDPLAVLTRHTPEGEGPTHTHELTEDIIDQFTGYMESEIQRVYQVQEDLKVLQDDQLIENYHYGINEKGEMDRRLARGLDFVLFPQLSKDQLSETNPELQKLLYGETNLVSEFTPDMRPMLAQEAEKFIQRALQQEYNKLRRHRLLDAEGNFSRPIIDSGYLTRTYAKNVDPQMRATLAEFSRQHSALSTAAVNGLAMTIEQDLLIHGDPAFFKNFDDLRKRTSGPAAFRRRLNTSDPGVRKFYSMAVARDVIKPSDYLSQLKSELGKIDGLNPARIRKILAPYEQVNTTDAQAYITLDRAVEILRGEGRWRPSDDQILQRWKNGETDILNTRGGRRIAQLFMTPFKGVHYGIEQIDPDSNLRVPVYLKYSQFVLLPGMVKRSAGLKALDRAMRGGDPAGNYIVDELVFESGVKVGRRAKRDISDYASMDLVPNKLSNENWGRQVETPTKGITEKGLDGTQLRRNILLGIRAGRDYGADNLSAAETEYRYNAVTSEIVRRGRTALESDMGVKIMPRTGLGRIGDINRFGQMMHKEAKDRNAANNVLESYQTKDNKLRVELEINPQGNRSEALFLSLFKNRAVRQDIFGGSYVQASSYGFKSYNEFATDQVPDYPPVMSYAMLSEQQIEEVTILGNVEGLKPPLIRDGKVTSAQVLAPSYFGQLVAETAKKPLSELTRSEVQEFFAENSELLQFIGYRIPNQGLSSIENLEIVGFLPEDLGDTLVVYEELTTKNDSDFDVDKMFALMPEFKIVNGKPVLYEFYENTNSKKQLGAIYNDRYERQGQLRSIVEKLDRVKALSEKEGLPLSEIQNRERNVDFEDGEWIIGKRRESQIEHDRTRLAEVPSREEFIEQNLGADPFIVNSDQALHNFRLRLMRDIMSNPLTMAESLMPITDEGLVEFARNLADAIGSQQVFEGAMEFLPSSQIEIGRRFRSGKNMIGILANHFGSHAISTKTNLNVLHNEVAAAFAKNSFTQNKKLTSSLSEYQDIKGREITEQLSTLMSGFLDATSDSWALELNLTDDTANIAALILRLGAGWERMLMFLNQPAIRELVELKPLASENLVRLRGASPEAHLVRHYSDMIKADLNVQDVGEAIKKRKVEQKDLSELLSENNLRINLQPTRNAQYYMDQIAVLQSFQSLQEVATSVANFVSTTKFDVDMPASVAELMINDLRMQEAQDAGIIDYAGYIDNSLLQPFQQVYKTANAIAAGTYLGRSMLGKEVTSTLLGNAHTPAFTGGEAFRAKRDKNTLRDIHNAMVVYALQSSEASQDHVNPVYRSPEQMKAMFYGDNTMARRLVRIKDKEHLADNYLVNYLQPSIEPGRPDFIEASYREKGVLFQNRLIHAWEQLLADSDPAVQAFANDLASYAYATSGMRRGMNTIHDLIPTQILQEVSAYFHDWKKAHANNRDALAYADQIARETLRNEYNNELLVPTVYRQHLRRKHFRDKLLAGFDIHEDNLPVGKFKVAPETFIPVPPQVIQHGEQLYKLVSEIPSEGRFVYGLLQKKGYHDGEFHIYEYFNPDGPSIIESNDVPWSLPFDETFYKKYAPVGDLFPADPDTGNRQFTMDRLLENKIC